MPDYSDENYPLTSSKKFSSIRFPRSGSSSKRRSELKAAISGPHVFDGGGISTTALVNAPLRTLNGTRPPDPNSPSTLLNGSSPPSQSFARSARRNSDAPFIQHHSGLAWPSNHPAITPVHGSPHHPAHTIRKKPRKVYISKPLTLNSSRSTPALGISRERALRSTQINPGLRWPGTVVSGTPGGNPDKVALQELLLSGERARGSNLLGIPTNEFDPRTMMESLPTLGLDLGASAASFGSVKQRTSRIDKSLRASRATLLSVSGENAQPDLVYMDDSDAFSSPPSTPSTPVWETAATKSIPKAEPKLTSELELSDVHAQIQAMIDSVNRPFTESRDYLGQDREPSNAPRNDIPLSLRPSNPMYRSLPPLSTTHKRSVSSPPLGSEIYYYAQPPDFRETSLYQSIAPIVPRKPALPASPPSKTAPTSPTSPIPADLMTPSTPTKKPSSEQPDSPSVYSQPSPSSQTGDITPTSSSISSPDHPYATSKHERLLAAISEGISSPTKHRSNAPPVLGLGRADNISLANSPLNTGAPVVPMIVVTDPNDDDLVYSESSFSIIDMYAGSVESSEVGLRRRRTRTTNSVRHVSPLSIERVLITS